MKILIILIVFVSIHKCSGNNLLTKGTWTSEEDELYVVKFTKDKFYEIYNGDTSVYKYSRSSKSSDENYLKKANVNLDFFSLEDGRCFEITGLTDSTLAYRHTVSGRMQIFHKSHPAKKNR
jgi:hypothetical protein